jgi:outer membrane biosynthesis protein TonB
MMKFYNKKYYFLIVITLLISCFGFSIESNAQTKRIVKKSQVKKKIVQTSIAKPKGVFRIATKTETRTNQAGDSLIPVKQLCTAPEVVGGNNKTVENKLNVKIDNRQTPIQLVKPDYPSAARAVRAGGKVDVDVLIDEDGNVICAVAINGHPLLRSASEKAALETKFSPTTLQGNRVKVTGIVTYNFVAQ